MRGICDRDGVYVFDTDRYAINLADRWGVYRKKEDISMGLGKFKKGKGLSGKSQKFVDESFPKCPMCHTAEPDWTMKEKVGLVESRMQFKCSQCGAVLSGTLSEISGLSNSKLKFLTDEGVMNALSKKAKGKDQGAIYIKVDEAGSAPDSKQYEGKEFVLDELQHMA